jgi:hypothetical protein
MLLKSTKRNRIFKIITVRWIYFENLPVYFNCTKEFNYISRHVSSVRWSYSHLYYSFLSPLLYHQKHQKDAFFWRGVLGFGLRVLCLPCKHSSTWAILPFKKMHFEVEYVCIYHILKNFESQFYSKEKGLPVVIFTVLNH